MNIDDIFSSIATAEEEEEVNYDILDRDSAEYRRAHTMNEAIRKQGAKRDEDSLALSLMQAAHLDKVTKDKYINLANRYTLDMKDNIFRNQFELHENYPDTSIDDWNDFLTDKIVSNYIAKHKRTLLKTAAEDNLANPLARNKRDSLKLLDNIEEKESREAQKNVVIMRLPDIYDD